MPLDLPGNGGTDDEPRAKLIIRLADGKERAIRYVAATTYFGPDGRPMTGQQFLERLFGDLNGIIESEDELRRRWSNPETRETLIRVLEARGFDRDKLADMRRLIDAPESDLFDVLAFVRFALPPKSRTDRADGVRRDGMRLASPEMRAFLVRVLQAYQNAGESELALGKLGDFVKAQYGTLADARAALGSIEAIRGAFVDVQAELYLQ